MFQYMDNHTSCQLELFSQTKEGSRHKPAVSGSLLRRLRVYEKTILFSMGFIITAVVAFSLGVEKGKDLAILKSVSRFDMAKQKRAQFNQAKNILKEKQSLTESKSPAAIPKQDSNIPKEAPKNYTIQLASYSNKIYAQREADTLKKKGLKPLILPKGRYVILCVGSFSDKANARTLLSDLEKQYRDCFIRRI
jgi:hypothetical protein